VSFELVRKPLRSSSGNGEVEKPVPVRLRVDQECARWPADNVVDVPVPDLNVVLDEAAAPELHEFFARRSLGAEAGHVIARAVTSLEDLVPEHECDPAGS
jgi:hypothetical protein